MVKQPEHPTIHWRRISLVERFSAIVFPLDVEELLAELPELGYIVPADKERLAPQGQQLALTRELATKGELRLRLNQDAKILGVEGKQATEVLEAFKLLRNVCKERLDPSKGFASAFVEIVGTAWATTGKQPSQVFSKVWAGSPVFDKLNQALKMTTTQRGIRLVSSLEIEAPSYREIDISPLIPTASRYHIEVVWREPTLERIFEAMEGLDSTLIRTIQALESF